MTSDTSHWLSVTGDTVTVQGHLGTREIPQFQETLRGFQKKGTNSLTVDLVNVDYMSSSYLGIIAAAAAALMDRGGRVKVRAIGQVLRLLKLAGLDKVVVLEKVQGWQTPPID